MAAPLLQAEIEIKAPVSKVWALISDLRRMPEWSPQCRWMRLLGPLRPGTRTVNVNRRGAMVWPTSSVITEVVPDQRLAFRIPLNRTVWSYDLEPTADGTRVVESRHAENGVSAVSNLNVRMFMGGVDEFEQHLLEGMRTSLARVKAAAER